MKNAGDDVKVLIEKLRDEAIRLNERFPHSTDAMANSCIHSDNQRAIAITAQLALEGLAALRAENAVLAARVSTLGSVP